MEKAALKQLNEHQENPPDHSWPLILEELDRRLLKERAHDQEIPPPPKTWDRITHDQRKINYRLPLAATLLLLLGLGWYLLMPSPLPGGLMASAESGYSLPPDAPVDGLRSLPTVTAPIASTRQKPESTFVLANGPDKPEAAAKAYLWVARQNGEAMRIARQWEGLSCCLSGELESAECDLQRDQWHKEVMASALGFQADPVIGLMQLLDSPNNP